MNSSEHLKKISQIKKSYPTITQSKLQVLEFNKLLFLLTILRNTNTEVRDLKKLYLTNEIYAEKFPNIFDKKILDSFKDSVNLLELLSKLPKIQENFSLVLSEIYENFILTEKNKTGSFYTPIPVINIVLDKLLDRNIENKTFLDPACGSGLFLISLLRKLDLQQNEKIKFLENNIFGVDLDPYAIELTKLLLIIEVCGRECFLQDEPIPTLSNIKVGNSLITVEEEPRIEDSFSWKENFLKLNKLEGFDFIIGNPPFGLSRNEQISDKEKNALRKIYGQRLNGKLNKYIIFMLRAYDLLNSSGTFALVTPNSWIGINDAKKFREFLYENKALQEILVLPKNTFPKIGVETFVNICSKKKQNQIRISKYNDWHKAPEHHYIQYPAWKTSPDLILPLDWNEDFNAILSRVEENSLPLKQTNFQAMIALQVYATGKGKPAQDKEVVQKKSFHSKIKKNQNCSPYLIGKDIKQFEVAWSGQYLEYGPWVAEFQPKERYQGPRVLIREIISKPPYLLNATYTEDEFFYNRSVLHIIANEQHQEEFQALTCILNSKLASFIFLLRGRKAKRSLFPKVLNADLKNFPLPKNFKEDYHKLSILYNKRKKLPEKTFRKDLDDLVYQAYQLDTEQVRIIENYLGSLS